MWGVGCVMYEMAVDAPLFSDDATAAQKCGELVSGELGSVRHLRRRAATPLVRAVLSLLVVSKTDRMVGGGGGAS